MPKLFSRAAQVGVCALVFHLGVPMHAADTPPTLRQDVKVYSPDRHFYAVSSVAENHTSVFRAGSKKPVWELPGYAPVLYLSDDGRHLVKGYEGGNILPMNAKGSEIFLTFYSGPTVAATLTLDQALPHWRELGKSTSGRPWGDFWGFEKPTEFVLRLHDGKKLAFNADTGKRVP